MQGHFHLGGGGSEQDEARLWAEAFPAGARIAVWPFAQSSVADRRRSGDWLTSALAALGPHQIDVWLAADDHDASLAGVDVVAIPGGNTFDLLHTLNEAGLLSVLHDHLARSGSVYGGSAGAVLAGADIGIALVADPNDVGLEDTTGLDLLHGLDVLPHYTDDQLGFAQDHHRRTGRPVLGLPERGGVVVAGTTARTVGPESVQVITRDDSVERVAGERWPLTDQPSAGPSAAGSD
jgi:dipeptidase E